MVMLHFILLRSFSEEKDECKNLIDVKVNINRREIRAIRRAHRYSKLTL